MPRNPFDKSNDRISQDPLCYFTGRVGFIEAFQNCLNAPAADPLRVLVFCGVGGIGKTTLIRKLSQDLNAARTLLPHARFDLDTLKDPTQAYREVLVRLRTDLGHFKIDFARFDLCLALMLASEGGAAPNLVQVNPTLNSVYQFALSLSPIPFTGAIAALSGHVAKLGAKHVPSFEDWLRRAGGTEDVIALRKRAQSDDQTLPDELMKRFAEDFNSLPARADKAVRGVLFLDTYERLWIGRAADGSRQSRDLDKWVRDLAGFCLHAGVLLVITGRDHLRWEKDEPEEWQGWLDQHQMGGLSAPDAQAFLSKCGIGADAPVPPTPLQQTIIQCSDEKVLPNGEISCHTLLLALCAEIALNTRRQTGQEPALEFFHRIPPGAEARELADRFLKSLHDRPMEMWLEELSLAPRFDKESALALRGSENRHEAEAAWELLTGFSFAQPQPDNFWRLHQTMRDALALRVSEVDAHRVHTLLCDHWATRGDDALAFFYYWLIDPATAWGEWRQRHDIALKERRIADARGLLTLWADVFLDNTGRRFISDKWWAAAHYVHGVALVKTPTAPRASVLIAAIDHLQDALRVYTEADFPQEWAATQNGLGNALRNLPTGDRAGNLRRAAACFEGALLVWNKQNFEQQWAGLQNNLASTFVDLPTGNRIESLKRAVACYEATLRVYTEAGFPNEWAMTQNGLGSVFANLPTGDRGQNLSRAAACFEVALRVFTEADFPQEWATAQNNLGNVLTHQPRGDRVGNLSRAISCFEAALRVRTKTDFPQEWAGTQHNLGVALSLLPTYNRTETLARAIASCQAALDVYTEVDFPQEWAISQHNLGFVHTVLGREKQDINQLLLAQKFFTAAERGYSAIGLTTEAAQMRSTIIRLNSLWDDKKPLRPIL